MKFIYKTLEPRTHHGLPEHERVSDDLLLSTIENGIALEPNGEIMKEVLQHAARIESITNIRPEIDCLPLSPELKIALQELYAYYRKISFSGKKGEADPYRIGHSEMAAQYLYEFLKGLEADGALEGILQEANHEYADNLQTREAFINLCRVCMLFHDLGKIGKEEILNAKRKLEPKEFDIIKQHPGDGARIFEHYLAEHCHIKIADNPILRAIQDSILSHHKHVDTDNGYPPKKPEEKLSLIAQLVAIWDVIEAMVGVRPYPRDPMDEKALIGFLNERCTGQFNLNLLNLVIMQMEKMGIFENIPEKYQTSLLRAQGRDLRAHPRMKVPEGTHFTIEGEEEVTGTIRDVSEGGISLLVPKELMEKIKRYKILTLEILFAIDKRIQLTIEIVRTQIHSATELLIGARISSNEPNITSSFALAT